MYGVVFNEAVADSAVVNRAAHNILAHVVAVAIDVVVDAARATVIG
jgi:hypothetical protein